MLTAAHELRQAGCPWVQIAAVLRQTYPRLSQLAAMRLAHGWSQRDAADQWCRRWPDDLKTFKNFSYWERWPAPSGYSQSLAVLTRLAELYQCAVADLVAGVGDFRYLDKHHRASGHREPPRDEPSMRSTSLQPYLTVLDDIAASAQWWADTVAARTSHCRQQLADALQPLPPPVEDPSAASREP